MRHKENMQGSPEIRAQLKTFGANLRRARMARNITLETLAERANLNIRSLQRFESGECNVLITTAWRLQHGIGAAGTSCLTTRTRSAETPFSVLP
jgi:transcriptional regulator with XRE-family HTH domain